MQRFVFHIAELGMYEVITAPDAFAAREKLRTGPLYRFCSKAVLISESKSCYRASD